MTAIRGAITVRENTVQSIKENAILLYNKILEDNPILKKEGLIFAIFASHTKDLTAYNTCTALRERFRLTCALECFQEAEIDGSLPRTIRLTVFCNADFSPRFVYLKDAAKLREDLQQELGK